MPSNRAHAEQLGFGAAPGLKTPAHLKGCPRSRDYYNKNKDDASLPTMLSGYRTLAVFQGLA